MGALDGRRIVVTGAGRGIGAEVAIACAAEGASLVVNDLGAAVDGRGADAGPAHDIVKRIRSAGGTAVPDIGDVADTEQAEALVETARREFGGVDVVINIAGIMRDHPLAELEPDDWDAVVRVHLRGTFNTARAAARHWIAERKGGYRLVNTTSGAGYFGVPFKPNYAAAKMGVIGFTYAVANDLMPYGVTANAVSPSGSTRMNAHKVRDPIPAANAAAAYVYLASTASHWLTGHVIAVRDRRMRLLSRPHYIREFVSDDGRWDLTEVFERFDAVFRPAVESSPENPYELEARLRTAEAAMDGATPRP